MEEKEREILKAAQAIKNYCGVTMCQDCVFMRHYDGCYYGCMFTDSPGFWGLPEVQENRDGRKTTKVN